MGDRIKTAGVAHQLMPAATSLAFLVNPSDSMRAGTLLRDAQAAAVRLGLQLLVLRASTDAEIEATLLASPVEAGVLVIGADAFLMPRANCSPNFRCAMRCPRFTEPASSPTPAA